MAACKLCGKPAGWLKSQHAECVAKRDRGIAEIVTLTKSVITGNSSAEGVNEKFKEIIAACHIQSREFNDAIVKAWEEAADHFLDDGELNSEEEQRLVAFAQGVNLTPEALNRSGAYSRVIRAGVVRDVLGGHLPRNRQSMPSTARFNFQRGELLVWAIDGVEYHEDRTRVHYEGRSQGVSVRIMSGVYYRVGAYKGHPVERGIRVHVDSGTLAITNKHLYFSGNKKSLRIRHDKIISITPYSDGVAIHRDAASAKPQLFITGDGWFIHNLLANAPNVEIPEAQATVEDPSRGLLGNRKRR